MCYFMCCFHEIIIKKDKREQKLPRINYFVLLLQFLQTFFDELYSSNSLSENFLLQTEQRSR